MRVNKKAILDTIEWAKTALANGMRVPPVPTSQVTEDIFICLTTRLATPMCSFRKSETSLTTLWQMRFRSGACCDHT